MNVTDLLSQGANMPDAALLLARVSVGGFFTISGFHKLFSPARRRSLLETFLSDHVPPKPFMWLIPCGELFGGLGVMFGALTVLAAAGLFALCLGACFLDGFKRIPGMKPLDRADYVDDVLYLPEVLYAVLLLVVIACGPGAFSLDSVMLAALQFHMI